MKRKIIATLLSLLGLIVIGYSILLFLGVFKKQQAGILVESDPVATVYINDFEVGKTPFETNRIAGEITLRIKPISSEGLILDDFETKLNLVPGIQTIVKRDFKENEENSNGAIVSFEKIDGDESFVTVVSVPDNARVLVDNKVKGYTPLRIKVPAGDHDLVVIAENYIEQKLPIRVFKGFKLTASVKLAKNSLPEVMPTPIPEVDDSKIMIKVNNNSVGFLRVRSGANIGFPEVARVKPDEEYEVIEEGENGKWFKIQFPDEEGLPAGRQGWVSAEFVTKI